MPLTVTSVGLEINRVGESRRGWRVYGGEMTTGRLILYGANGFTGRRILRRLLERGLRPILAGRNSRALRALAGPEQLQVCVAEVSEPAVLGSVLSGARVLLNAAGPFAETALPLARACIDAGVDYLDVAGEVSVFERLAALHRLARERGSMLLPGVGFDVVASDVLVALATRELGPLHSVKLGVSGLSSVSRGSARTLADQWYRPPRLRRDGALVDGPAAGLTHGFEFTRGTRRLAHAVSWGDVVTAFHTSGAPNITVYFEATASVSAIVRARSSWGGWAGPMMAPAARVWSRWLPEGPPSEDGVSSSRAVVCIDAVSADQCRRFRTRIRTPEVYTFTGESAAAAAQHVCDGARRVGFQTPGRLLGPTFVEALAGVELEQTFSCGSAA